MTRSNNFRKKKNFFKNRFKKEMDSVETILLRFSNLNLKKKILKNNNILAGNPLFLGRFLIAFFNAVGNVYYYIHKYGS